MTKKPTYYYTIRRILTLRTIKSMENQDEQVSNGNEIVPKSTNIRLSSRACDSDHEIRDLNVSGDERQTRRSSNLFQRLMSMDTMQSMSARNLLLNNPVFRKRAFSILINVLARTLTLGMNVLLVMLSTAFCVAQMSEVHLKLYNECEPKTLDEIYHHSYLAGLQENGSVVVNAASQWGWTHDACYTTRSFQLDTDQLWRSNVYEHEWNINIDYKVVLFGISSLYSFCVLIYNVFNLVRDLYHLKKNTVHTLSESRDPLHHQESEMRTWSNFTIWLNDLVETENTRWVLRCVFLECVEFSVALSSMLLYNGYNWNDPENERDVYLAEKPEFIKIFAAGLAANMFGSAVLWISYMSFPNTCHGLTFRTVFFLVEDLSDLFYTLFPLIVAYSDTFNSNSDELMVLLGQFHVDGFIAFAPRFFFLCALCFKTHHLVYSSHAHLMNRYRAEFDSEESRSNWIEDDDPHRNHKRWFLFVVSVLYTIFGITVLFKVLSHFDQAEAYCNLIREFNFMENDEFNPDLKLSKQQKLLLDSNPELFLWDECLYQVLPFTNDEEQSCQCRVFVIDWDLLNSTNIDRNDLNLSQRKMLTGLLKHNIMLEKFWTYGGYDVVGDFAFDSLMFKSIHMKAFHWPHCMSVNGFGDSMASWGELEYLAIDIEQDFGNTRNFKQLNALKLLDLDISCRAATPEIPVLSNDNVTLIFETLCFLKRLQIIVSDMSMGESIPHCFGNLEELRVIALSFSLTIQNMPFSILGLPNLAVLDLFNGHISWESLLNYNLPEDLDRNDGVKMQAWLNSHVAINKNADFYFQMNPICNEFTGVYPDELRQMLMASCDYGCSYDTSSQSFCNPQSIGNGACNQLCNTVNCKYDGGDCIQLCFADQLTNCSWSDLLNDQCDDQCDNEYCTAFRWNVMSWGEEATQHYPDFDQCSTDSIGPQCLVPSMNNSFLDSSLLWSLDDTCRLDWVGDGTCDDLCQTEACAYDDGDCDVPCGGICGTITVGWDLLDTERLWIMEHDWVCLEKWALVVALGGNKLEARDCNELLQEYDFNQDGNLNVREFTAMTSREFFQLEKRRALQVNCSSCEVATTKTV